MILPSDFAYRTREALRSARGAFDLPSIITGVVVVGVLVAGALAAIFGVIPFAQDNGAKQDLAAVRTAEGVAKTKDGKFLDGAGLQGAKYLSSLTSSGVKTDAGGSCYVAVAKSGTGAVFYATDASTEPKVLTSSTDTGCIPVPEQESLAAALGAKPSAAAAEEPFVAKGLENGGFEAGLTGWATGGTGTIDTVSTVTWAGTMASRTKLTAGGEATLSQSIGVPAAGTTTLSFWHLTGCTSVSCEATIEARNKSGELLGTPSVIAKTVRYTQKTIDLTPYKGKNIQLVFRVKSVGDLYASVYTFIDAAAVTTTAPDAPTNVVAWTNDASATVQWTPPAYGAAAVTSYTVTPYLGAVAQPPVTVTGDPAPSAALVTGLANGSTYTFTVKASNVLGSSAASLASIPVPVQPNGAANGGFEAGLAGWTTSGTGTVEAVSGVTKADRLAARTLVAPGAEAALSQVVDVPAAGTTTLSFWHLTGCTVSACSVTVETQSIAGDLLGTPTVIPKTTGYTQKTVDLTPYKGTKIKIAFRIKSLDNTSASYFTFLDAVSITTK